MEYLTFGLPALIQAMAWLAAGVLAAWMLGRYPISYLVSEEADTGAGHLFSLALGLTVLSLIVLAIGSCGMLSPGVLRLVIAALALLGAAVFLREYVSGFMRWRWARSLGWGVAAVAALSALALVLPPAGTDALSYHLTDPKIFLQQGRIAPIPFSRESLWPYLTEMLFLLGLGCQGTSAALAWHWVFFPLTACVAAALAVKLGETRDGGWAAWFWVMSPAAFAQSSDAYVDLALAFFGGMTFLAAAYWMEKPARGRVLLWGLMAGACMSVKLLGLGVFAVGIPIILIKSRRRIGDLSAYALGCLLVAGIWYARSWWFLGNPIYPFFPDWFGGHGLVSDIAEKGAGTSWLHFIVLPWNLVMRPYTFGGEIAGPWILLFGWLGCGLYWKRPAGRVLTVAAGVTLLFLFTQSQMTRFFLMLFPFVAAASARGYSRLRQEGGALAAAALAAVLLVSGFHLGMYAYRLRDAAALTAGKLTAQQYLERRDRSYKAYAFLKSVLKPEDRVLNAADAKRFWGPADQMTVVNGALRDSWKRGGVSIADFLKHGDYDYLLLTERSNPEYWDYARSHGYREVMAYDFQEPTEVMKFRILKRTAA